MPAVVEGSRRQECQSEDQLADWGIRPSATPGWATQAKIRKKCCYGREKNLGQYSSLSLSSLISHTQQTSTLSRRKCESYIVLLYVRHWSSPLSLLRSRDELIRDVLLWTPTHGRAKAGRLAWTYIQQLCEDTVCCPEDLPRAMNDREEWRESVRDICATSAIWWWWRCFKLIFA